jgi:predicted RNA binding protein YcfA (HicA-like mRNA interferase family)
MKVKELIKVLEKEGWSLDRIKGSHHVFRHDSALRSVVVPVHGKELSDFLAQKILKQAKAALRED